LLIVVVTEILELVQVPTRVRNKPLNCELLRTGRCTRWRRKGTRS
jgi:hypothetical protein